MTIERTLPAGQRRELERQEIPEQEFVFLTITHKAIVDAIRVVSNSVDIVLAGKTHTAFQFQLIWVSDTEEAPFAELEIQNVDRIISTAIRDMRSPPKFKVEICPGSDFNQSVDPHTEIGTAGRLMTAQAQVLQNVEVDAMFIRGRLATWDFSRETWPGNMATKAAFPGLFR